MGKIVRSAFGGMMEGAAILFDLSCACGSKKMTQHAHYRRALDDIKNEIIVMQKEASDIPHA